MTGVIRMEASISFRKPAELTRYAPRIAVTENAGLADSKTAFARVTILGEQLANGKRDNHPQVIGLLF
jgi:hypothetical protein